MVTHTIILSLRQEDFSTFEANLGYMGSNRLQELFLRLPLKKAIGQKHQQKLLMLLMRQGILGFYVCALGFCF